MRITQRAVALTSLQGLNRNLDAVGKLQQQLTSGRIINAPSDSPTGTNKAMQTRAEQAAVAQQARNISDAKGWLGQGDSTLREMLDTTRRVRDLTVQGLNTGAVSEASQKALSTEVASLREGLLSLANTLVQGRPLFGGVTTGSKAYNADGTWAGQAGPPVTRRLSESETVRVDLTGTEAFGPDGANLFDIVGRITANLTDPNAGALLETDLADLDVAIKRMSTAVADVGSRASRVDRAEQLNFDRSLSLTARLGETENVDLPETIMRLQMQQVGYEAALAATAKAISPTLLDYLR
ncbi:flagellar hook-associated protein FlgL [Blastococcus tunisiensis]|uniref:Flagellar hook-associated protein 3 FlgL n=1 Tax=Blastococcus tunisiensis TaxID=1798228 RepID=A0A1I2KU99_9ACTN|nr:flagellar hook-associated protein FlgL [Blastococcus sp. DSM 46838]SFF69909.1 flagellar hook-associated protein 3 FlgL [Blastococcus sp. DSM 46838]